MSDRAKSLQEKINAAQRDIHQALLENAAKMGEERNQIYAARAEALKKMMAAPAGGSESLPQDFWARAIIAGLDSFGDGEENTSFLGPYDAELLKSYLIDMKVVHSKSSQRLSFFFKPNPFFEETELWAELVSGDKGEEENAAASSGKKEDDEEEEEEEVEDHWTFSGVTWKPGHGPVDEEDEEEDEDDEGAPRGTKRPRDNADAKDGAPVVTGPSMLDVFSEMPPHPTKDKEFLSMLEDEENEEDEEGIEERMDEAIESWEEEMEDRERLLSLLLEDIFHNPAEAIMAAGDDKAQAKKQLKTE
eukprot:gene11728-8073_t